MIIKSKYVVAYTHNGMKRDYFNYIKIVILD